MRETHIRILCRVLNIDMVYEDPSGSLVPFFDATDCSPLMRSAELRNQLKITLQLQDAPYLHHGVEDCYFASLKAEQGWLYMGPMCHQKLNVAAIKRMHRAYGIDHTDFRNMRAYTLPEMRDMILLTNSMLGNINLENEELLQLNRIISQSEEQMMRDEASFQLQDDLQSDEDLYKHTYQEEQLVVEAIKDGDAAEAIRISENMDRDSGRLGVSDLQHRRLNAVVAITICSRAAIEGGVTPADAYKLSGFYITKCDTAKDPAHMLHYRNRAIEEFAGRVRELKEKRRYSGYVDRCKDYVNKNYRQKIYLDDIAESLGISPSYLSRQFHSETGMKLQDYINEVRVERAANLMLYTDMSLAEIAEYVCFPNQSYFGKIFLKVKGMTPRRYREAHSIRESSEK